MDVGQIAAVLAECRARVLESEEHQGLGEDVLVRYWEVGQEDLDGCLAFLKAQTTVVDPMKGTRWARTGTWYCGQVDHKPGNANPLVASAGQGLVWLVFQVLSKGDRIITINEECAAWIRETIIHTYNPTIPSGVAGAGQIKRVTAAPTALGRERTEEETLTPKDQVAVAVDDFGLHRRVTTLHTEGASVPAAEAAVGKTVETQAQPTEAGNYRTVQGVDESKHWSVPEYEARRGEREVEYRSEEYHDPNPPTAREFRDAAGVLRTVEVDADGNAVFDGKKLDLAIVWHELDEFRTHNFKRVRSVRLKNPADGTTWTLYAGLEFVTEQVYSETLGRYWNSRTLVYWIEEAHELRYFDTAAEAAAFIGPVRSTDENGTVTFHDTGGSRIAHTGEFEWECHRVERTKHLLTTYEYLEPLE